MNADCALDAHVPTGTTARLESGDRRPADVEVTRLGGPYHQLRGVPDDLRAGELIAVGGVAGVVLEVTAERHGPDNDVLVHLTRLHHGEDDGDHDPVRPVSSTLRRASPPDRAAARARAHPTDPSDAATRLEALIRATKLTGLRVARTDHAPLAELTARQRVVDVAGTHVHADALDELCDQLEPTTSADELADVLHVTPDRAQALIDAARR